MFISAIRKQTPRKQDISAGTPVRLTIVQFGDYAEAAERFETGGEENYYAQRYTVDFVTGLAARAGIASVNVISFGHDRPPSLHRGVASEGVQLYPPDGPPRHQALVDAIARSRPTHLVVVAPLPRIIAWGLKAGCEVLPLFADSFHMRGWRDRLRIWWLVRLLNRRGIDFVANHGLAAARDLARIGVSQAKILPFDWPELIDSASFTPKSGPQDAHAFRILYVGQIRALKGVGDAIRALALLRARGIAATLDLIGAGEVDAMRALAISEGVGDHVAFLGKMPHAQVIAAMRAHDAIVVPSHHAYPEGLPMTLYEALCVKTPLVVSDHPMFSLRIRDGVTALVHPEQDSPAMADALARLATDRALYARMTRQAGDAVADYLCPLKWDRLVEGFIAPQRRDILSPFSLANRQYR